MLQATSGVMARAVEHSASTVGVAQGPASGIPASRFAIQLPTGGLLRTKSPHAMYHAYKRYYCQRKQNISPNLLVGAHPFEPSQPLNKSLWLHMPRSLAQYP